MLSETLLLFAATICLSSAQTTAEVSGPVVSLFIPNADPQKLVASIVGESGPVTTYVVACPVGTDENDCGFLPPATITEGSGTFAYTQSETDFTASVECTWAGTTSGTCTESFGGAAANFPGVTTTTLGSSDITFLPVTITASMDSAAATALATGTVGTTAVLGTSSGTFGGTIASTGTGSGSVNTNASAGGPTATATATISNSAGIVGVEKGGIVGFALLGLMGAVW